VRSPMRRTSLLLLCTVLLCCVLDRRVLAFAAKKGLKRKSKASSVGGFGKAAGKTAGPTVAQRLKSSIDAYDALERLRQQLNAAEAMDLADGKNDDDGPADAATTAEPTMSVTRYSIALRSSIAASEFSDWVPIALLALGCGSNAGDPAAFVPSALGACLPVVVEGGAQAFPTLRKLGRETLEYAYEPLDSFETHVLEGLQGRTERRVDAAETLGVDVGASAVAVKKAHRKLMMELHPDRFVGDDEGAKAAQQKMLEVQEAYAELGGGQGPGSGSFYASIGGKARVSFSGELPKDALAPLGKPREEMELPYEDGGWRVGVAPMTESIMREFVTRNAMRVREAKEENE